jgi:hypothetical protein
MPIKVIQVDSQGRNMGVAAYDRDGLVGAVVYTRELASRVSTTRAFLNETYGSALNQDGTFTGTPVGIHNGTDSVEWTGAAVTGTWDFADTVNPYAGTKCVSLTSANNNDSATFTGGSSVTGSNYSAITMQIWLDTYSSANHEIQLQFSLSGVLIGVAVNISDYIDAALLSEYQGVVIPLTDLGIENLVFDRATITALRSGGSKPTFRIDNLQVEETGGGLAFTVSADPRTIFYIDQIKFTFTDNVTGNAALDYSKILGATLANGLIITRVTRDGPVVGRVIKSVYDFESIGFTVSAPLDNGTNSMITAVVDFSRALAINALYNERIDIVINDDLSVLTNATAIVRGESEFIDGGTELS